MGSAVNIIASLEVTEGLKILMGKESELHGRLIYVEVWAATMEQLVVQKGDGPCPACDLSQFKFLEAREGSYLTSLCGREAVQVNVRGESRVSFPDLAGRLNSVGQVTFNDYMLRFLVDGYKLTIFPDGRSIIQGTTDEAVARTLYARYVGL